jgi:hypothetical protein
MNSQADPEIQKILPTLNKFGFVFFGYDENKKPLVKAPNGQVVFLDVAYQFVKEQIEKNEGESTGNVEDMPEIPQMPQAVEQGSESNVESGAEKSPEQKQEEKKEDQNIPNLQGPMQQVQVRTPQVQIKKPKQLPFGDGFQPKTFDPEKVDQVLKYIEKNSKKSAKTSDKWLAEMFKKFYDETMDNKK